MSDLEDFKKLIKVSAIFASDETLKLSRLDSPGCGSIARIFQLDRRWWSIFNFQKNKRVCAAINAYVAIQVSQLFLWQAYETFKSITPRMKTISSTNDECFKSFLNLFHSAFRLGLALGMKEERNKYELRQTFLLLSQLPASGSGKGTETLIDLNYEYKLKFKNEFYIQAIATGLFLKDQCKDTLMAVHCAGLARTYVGFDDILKKMDEMLLSVDKNNFLLKCNPPL